MTFPNTFDTVYNAALEQNIDLLSEALSLNTIDEWQSGNCEYSAVSKLAQEGKFSASNWLLKHGANINYAVKGAAAGGHVEYVESLLRQGASICFAARGIGISGNRAYAETLLNRGARISDVAWGVGFAADKTFAEILLKRVNPITTMAEGALIGGHQDFADSLINPGFFAGLFGKQVDIKSVATTAAIAKNKTYAQSFLSHGASIDDLAIGAASGGDFDEVDALLSQGANINFIILSASVAGHKAYVESLLMRPNAKIEPAMQGAAYGGHRIYAEALFRRLTITTDEANHLCRMIISILKHIGTNTVPQSAITQLEQVLFEQLKNSPSSRIKQMLALFTIRHNPAAMDEAATQLHADFCLDDLAYYAACGDHKAHATDLIKYGASVENVIRAIRRDKGYVKSLQNQGYVKSLQIRYLTTTSNTHAEVMHHSKLLMVPADNQTILMAKNAISLKNISEDIPVDTICLMVNQNNWGALVLLASLASDYKALSHFSESEFFKLKNLTSSINSHSSVLSERLISKIQEIPFEDQRWHHTLFSLYEMQCLRQFLHLTQQHELSAKLPKKIAQDLLCFSVWNGVFRFLLGIETSAIYSQESLVDTNIEQIGRFFASTMRQPQSTATISRSTHTEKASDENNRCAIQ